MSDGARELPITDARDRLADVVNEAAYAGQVTYLTRRGRRLAAVVPVEVVEAAERWEDEQLGRMADEGLAEMERTGKRPAPLEKVRRELSSVSARTGIPASSLAILREHRAEIGAAAERVGARNVRVFGSVARGEDTPMSDVDLLVDFPARERGLLPLLTLAEEVEQIVGRQVDVAAVEVMAEPVRERALAEAVPL